MIAPHLQQAMETLAGRAVNSLFEGFLLAVFVALLLRVSGRQNARTRFSVWFVTLLGIAVLPFVSFENSMHRAVAAHVTLPGSWALALLACWGLGMACLV